MAQKVEVHLEDDLDGGPVDDTIAFGPDGKGYEIDLSAINAEKLREALRPYAAAGRKTTRSSSAHGPRPRASDSDPDTATVRTWANENGHKVSARAHIHQHIRNAYYAAS